jgi:hypothetical protein
MGAVVYRGTVYLHQADTLLEDFMKRIIWISAAGLFLCGLTAGCGGSTQVSTEPPPPQPSSAESLPQITSLVLSQAEVERYEPLEMTLSITAEYPNPYDLRQVSLDGVFRGPAGEEMRIPGYWDGEQSWRMRFTPPSDGRWDYALTVTDRHGTGLPAEGSFQVTPSNRHGWILPGRMVAPAYSNHYLAYADSTPFYGFGHCDALNILVDGFDIEKGVGLFDKMAAAGENYVVWWPFYGMSPVNGSYDQYSVSNMKIIDLIVEDAEEKGILVIFTIWDHPELRGQGHPWGAGRWETNGFSKLSDIDAFFTEAEPWAWQENLYRYVIARWGYSPAIGMWQTVSEINGTNAYDQTDAWHEKVNAFFVEHDPYRHPTTASMSGDVEWPAGHQVMDAPQVHLYNFKNESLPVDVAHSAQVLADWTKRMWNIADKPNWVGEFGVPGDVYYPELYHNSIWAALASGAAMTPAEWSGGGTWGIQTPAMNADIGRMRVFLNGIPLVKWNPTPVDILSTDSEVRAWGLAGKQGGLIWAQDFSLEGRTIDIIRAGMPNRTNVQLDVTGLPDGTYFVTPFDTWKGVWLESSTVVCTGGQSCRIGLPKFQADIVIKLERH